MVRNSRDRVTIELRGMRDRLQALAATRKLTTAAFVRKALVAVLDHEPSCADDGGRARRPERDDFWSKKVGLRVAQAEVVDGDIELIKRKGLGRYCQCPAFIGASDR